MVRALTLAATACVASAVVAWPAAAHARVTSLGTAVSPVRADGERYAAWESPPGTARILDVRTGRSLAVELPRECHPRPYRDSGLVAVGGGQVLWQCHRRFDEPYAVLFDAATGSLHAPAGEEALLARFHAPGASTTEGRYLDVGRHWLQAMTYGYHWVRLHYLNWRTGELRDEPRSARHAIDLDRSSLLRRICRPLGRLPPDMETTESIPPFQPFHYRPPFGLSEGEAAWQLQVCGRRTPRLRAPGRDDLQLGRRVLTWSDQDVVYAYGLRSRRRWAARIGSGNAWLSPAHAAHLLFASVRAGEEWLLYALRIPARVRR